MDELLARDPLSVEPLWLSQQLDKRYSLRDKEYSEFAAALVKRPWELLKRLEKSLRPGLFRASLLLRARGTMQCSIQWPKEKRTSRMLW